MDWFRIPFVQTLLQFIPDTQTILENNISDTSGEPARSSLTSKEFGHMALLL
jgi:hypothetical protein